MLFTSLLLTPVFAIWSTPLNFTSLLAVATRQESFQCRTSKHRHGDCEDQVVYEVYLASDVMQDVRQWELDLLNLRLDALTLGVLKGQRPHSKEDQQIDAKEQN